MHGPKLEHAKDLAIETYTLLQKEDGTRRGQLHERGYQQEKRRRQGENQE